MRSQAPLTRHQILLFEGDFNRLGELYPRKKVAAVVRDLVRKHIERLEGVAPPPSKETINLIEELT